jgi:hypothetical protein
MSDTHDLEQALVDGMRASTESIVASPELRHRLTVQASSVRPRARWGGARSFLTTRSVAVAAAVVAVLGVGAVVLVLDGAAAPTPPAARHIAAPSPAVSETLPAATTPAATTTAPVSEAATTGSSPAPSATLSAAPAGLADCSAPTGAVYQPTTTQDFIGHIVGVWVACSKPSIFNTPDAGLQIDADGHFAKLVRDQSGRLMATSGYLNGGTWTAVDASAMNGRPYFQINLVIDGSGTVITVPQFAGTTARFDNYNGPSSTLYVRTSEAVIPAATPTTTPPSGLSGCSISGEKVYTPTSTQDSANHIVGTWLACTKPSIFGTADAGLQINSDGRWAKLVRDTSNRLVAASGALNGGTWQIVDDSAMNGRPYFQINLTVDGSGTVITKPVFVGTAIHLDNNHIWATTYVPTSEKVTSAR